MQLVGTLGTGDPVTFVEAVLRSVPAEGGLYQPTGLPSIRFEEVAAFRGRPFGELAAWLTDRLIGDELAPGLAASLARDAFTFDAPTRRIEPGIHVLELFHGPTMAFKDFGARFLARIVSAVAAAGGGRTTILVATSGDTGSAVANGFHGVPGVNVVVLYPAGRVSAFQEAQMATLGGNIHAWRVPGTFDDCQRLVRTALRDPALAPLGLSSANSINIGRLLPQAFYYVQSWIDLDQGDRPLVFAVPSGNLGNLTAGVIASRLGVPAGRFVAATNVNDVLPEFLSTGVYRARPSVATVSNAMDVGDPGNFDRLSALFGRDVDAMRRTLWGEVVTDDRTLETIVSVHRRTRYVLDPHGAVAYAAALGYRTASADEAPIVVLATAHPGKFAETVGPAIGFEPEVPERWKDWRSRPVLARDLESVRYDAFRAALWTVGAQRDV
jgi:threonine synthase